MQLRMTLQSDIYSGRRPIPGPNAIPHPQPSFRKPKLARLSRHIRTLASAEPETTKRSSRQATPTTPPAPGAPPPSAPPPPPEEDEKEHEKPHRYPLDVSRSWISIVTDKAVDAVDDIGVHLRRSIGPPPIKNDILSTRQKDGRMALSAAKPIVLVLGSGWAAHAVVKVIDTDKFCVACISPTNHFLFTPMLPGTAVGTIEFRSLLEPMRVANPFINYFEVRVSSLHAMLV
jgi:NADH:ubiquinone reductase (non-electrogenic)